jgi:hypothetical protein
MTCHPDAVRTSACLGSGNGHLYWVEHHAPEQLFVLLFIALLNLLGWAVMRREKE